MMGGSRVARADYLLLKELEAVLGLLTPQNRIIMRVAAHTGLRIGDVLNLKTSQLAPRFWVTEQKTRKRRQVGLPMPLLSDIRAQAGEVWAFPGRKPEKHKTRQAVWKDVKRAAEAYRMPQNVSVHSARKYFAVDLLEKYGDFDRVQRALNHSNMAVTMLYAMADKRLSSGNNRRRSRSGGKMS